MPVPAPKKSSRLKARKSRKIRENSSSEFMPGAHRPFPVRAVMQVAMEAVTTPTRRPARGQSARSSANSFPCGRAFAVAQLVNGVAPNGRRPRVENNFPPHTQHGRPHEIILLDLGAQRWFRRHFMAKPAANPASVCPEWKQAGCQLQWSIHSGCGLAITNSSGEWPAKKNQAFSTNMDPRLTRRVGFTMKRFLKQSCDCDHGEQTGHPGRGHRRGISGA